MIHMICIVLLCHLLFPAGASESGIVGGKESKPHSRRYMASLQFGTHHTCGGFLIREDFVLTAAHCQNPSQKMTVVLGAHNIRKEEKSQQRIEVEEYFLHPKYTEYDYDIMLLKLKTNATINKYVKTISIPKMDKKLPANTSCMTVGWGKTGAKENSSPVLKEAKEKLQFNFECRNIWQEYFQSNRMICTSFKKTGGGVCQGDSGGPLICNNIPVGITALTKADNCNDFKYPHIFTKIHFYLPWIKRKMRGLGNVA